MKIHTPACCQIALAIGLATGTIYAAGGPPGKGWTLIFHDDFSGHRLNTQWATYTDSYSDNCRGNHPDHKLEYNLPANLRVGHHMLTITAKRQNYTSPSGKHYTWTSGLITTGRSCGHGGSGFEVRPGDYYGIYAKLPGALGAWPAAWTWRNEVDMFEYHPDNPSILELTNHTGRHARYRTHAGHALQRTAHRDRHTGAHAGHRTHAGYRYDAGYNLSKQWHYFGVLLGKNHVTYYLDGKRLFSDDVGFQSQGAVLIVNLSISDGYYHPAPPSSVNSMEMKVRYVKVWRRSKE